MGEEPGGPGISRRGAVGVAGVANGRLARDGRSGVRTTGLTAALGRFMAALGVLAALGVAGVPAMAQTLDDRVYAIAREVMCPVCQGQTVAESGSALAAQMRAEIRRRLLRGESREQIIAYFVEQFGEAALAAPPRRGVSLLLWVGPVAALLVGAVILARALRRWTAAPRRSPEGAAVPPPSEEDLARLRRELREMDG